MKYRKKPVEVDAMQWDGSVTGVHEIEKWSHTPGIGPNIKINQRDDVLIWVEANETWLPIEPGEWIIRDPQQPTRDLATRYYPCKPDIFEATYEPVDNPLANLPAPQWDGIERNAADGAA